MKKVFVVISLFLVVCGCTVKYTDKPYSPDILFNEAKLSIKQGNINKAISLLKKIDNNYIFTSTAIDAEVLLIWLNYQKNNFDQAELFAESFLKYYPYNPYTPWVEYMYALIIYQQIPYKKRDITKGHEALNLFKDYIKKYPNTDYAKDLQYKSVFVKNIIASRVMEIGNYYLKHKVYIGAINRFKEVIDVYNDTVFIPEALYRLVNANISIGLNQEAIKYFQLLKDNYKSTVWYTKSYYLVKHFQLINSKEI